MGPGVATPLYNTPLERAHVVTALYPRVTIIIVTRCNFTQRPHVDNSVTRACSAARALETRGRCVKLEVDSLKFDRRKQRCLPKEESQ